LFKQFFDLIPASAVTGYCENRKIFANLRGCNAGSVREIIGKDFQEIEGF
jgi:hypothetical protein